MIPSLLHIEDDYFWLEIVAKWAKSREDICYAGGHGTLRDGLAALTARPVEIMILDLNLPDASSCEAVEKLSILSKRPKIILLTVERRECMLYRVRHMPVSSLIWKSKDSINHLCTALGHVTEGRSYFPPNVNNAISLLYQQPHAFFKLLSPREIGLLSAIGRGESDEEIAKRLNLSATTIKAHRLNIMHKLGLTDARKLMRWAIEKGFGAEGLN